MQFDVKKETTLEHDAQVTFSLEGTDFKIIAHREGVRFVGDTKTFQPSREDMGRLAQAIGSAMTFYTQVRPRILSTKGEPL
jgi:hypothetical protein